MTKPVVNPFPELPDFNCFACGPNHAHGLRLKFFADGEGVYTDLGPREDLSGVPNILHGGIQATLLDEVMWWTIFHGKQRFSITRDLRVEFKLPVKTKHPLRASGRLVREEKNLIWAQAKITAGERVLATAEGSYFLPNQKMLARGQGIKVAELPELLTRYLPA